MADTSTQAVRSYDPMSTARGIEPTRRYTHGEMGTPVTVESQTLSLRLGELQGTLDTMTKTLSDLITYLEPLMLPAPELLPPSTKGEDKPRDANAPMVDAVNDLNNVALMATRWIDVTRRRLRL